MLKLTDGDISKSLDFLNLYEFILKYAAGISTEIGLDTVGVFACIPICDFKTSHAKVLDFVGSTFFRDTEPTMIWRYDSIYIDIKEIFEYRLDPKTADRYLCKLRDRDL